MRYPFLDERHSGCVSFENCGKHFYQNQFSPAISYGDIGHTKNKARSARICITYVATWIVHVTLGLYLQDTEN